MPTTAGTSVPAAGALSPERLRADFPILEREVNGRPLAYLDNAATSQRPAAVIDAMDDFYRRHNAPVHRSVYRLAEEATALYEGARELVAAFVGAAYEETIFTRNATEAINLVAYAWGREHVGAGDVVLITQMEHHSNIVPWQLLCQETGARLEYLAVSDEGTLDLDELDAWLERGVRLVACAHISNVLGTINPVDEIARRARAAGTTCLIDGAQAVPQLPVDVAAIGADFYAFTGHKMLGPTGIGVLHGRRELLQSMRPFISGGHMIRAVGLRQSSWNDLPFKFEAGTSPIAEGVGLGAAVDYLAALGMRAVRAHERSLTAYALERLGEVEGLRAFGPPDADRRGGVVSFAVEGIHAHDVAQLLDRDAVCVRAGHHCAMPLMERLGVPATARASFAVYNTRAEVDRLVEAIEAAKQVFQG